MKKIIILLIALTFLSNLNINDYKKQIDFLNSLKNKYNKEYAILIDYSKNSSRDRMFLVNLKTGAIIKSFKVAHGRGDNKYFSFYKKFSNQKGSNLSSVGVSIITNRRKSSWGLGFNYTIKGLDNTNYNNTSRNIVLHSWEGIQDYWVLFLPLPQSQGCPTISNKSLKYLDDFIKNQRNKKIIIYSFNS